MHSVGSKENQPKHPKSDNLDQDELDQVAKNVPDQVAKACPIRSQKRARSCFATKSVRFGRTELSLFLRNPRREIYKLGMLSGPVFCKSEGNSCCFPETRKEQVEFS